MSMAVHYSSDMDWKDVPGYDGVYQISRYGEVRSYRQNRNEPKPMTQYLRKRGSRGHARFVKLTDCNGKSRDVNVLRIMANVWLGGLPEGKVPYHKNGDLNDHCINNIGFASREKLGKMTGAKARRMPVAKVDRNGEVVEVYTSARAAAKANFMSYQAVLDRCNGKVKKPFALDGHNYVFDR